ncbi:asparagine synthase (glutamine-hydrolyzing) [Sphingomonas sp. URHD0057]|uniref:asparagine synthase (glutamine-hydrolyzing) n=1 Tax=Sphingomonas sp. URHD0057 TaxID=1380389 RepID=UPI0006842570|nr:asparagine synthase (glutamine-hydrolyzing) [Sphingomonas sp. URHD0057]
MCGIAGFVDPGADMAMLRAMTDRVSRRGPDDQGYFLEDGVGVGHRRLSIIDLSPGGHQPMVVDDLVITFNGEIYNYREIRAELERLGDGFASASDTEVILKAFRRWGPACVERFIGMFAMAIYDRRDRALYLFRDRAGVKPLYYYWNGGRLAFGSELKCFQPYLTASEKSAISNAALSEFFAFGYIGSELSILEDIRKVPPAHYLKLHEGRLERHRYWEACFEPDESWEGRTEQDLLDELEALAISAFNYRMVADVPVGVFLSSGVDSSLVAAILSKHHGRIHTFTVGFGEADYDESPDARRIAEHIGSDHTEARLDAAQGFEILRQFACIYDEPFGDTSGVPTSFVSGLAKSAGMKVVLSGDGGDELFGGYERYTQFLDRWTQSRRIGTAGRFTARAAFAGADGAGLSAGSGRFARYADLLRHEDFIAFYQNMRIDSSVRELADLIPAFQEPSAASSSGDLLALMSQWDFDRYLPDDNLVKVDRATMFHSIEGREPFLDQRLIEFGARLPTKFKIRNGETKYLLKRLLARYLPDDLCRLPKRGFAVPVREWIRDFYQREFIDMLGSVSSDVFDRSKLLALLDRYRAGKPVNYSLLWLIFCFQAWFESWNSEARPPPQADHLALRISGS